MAKNKFFYILPNNDEELIRLNKQHELLKICNNGIYRAPIDNLLEKGINILDIGCGSGIWIKDMINKFPVNKYWGLDCSKEYIDSIKLKNCNFKIGNIINDFPLKENDFNFIHQRLLIGAIPKNKWSTVINNIKKGLKNNGWIELVECYMKPINAGPKFTKLMEYVIEILKNDNLDPFITKKLGNILKENEFENISESYTEIPLNTKNDVGITHIANWKGLLMAIDKKLMKILNISNIEDFKNYINDCIKECDEYDTFFKWYTIYGQYQKI